MQGVGLPLWAIALVVAVIAPFCARAWGSMVERRAHDRTLRALQGLTGGVGGVADADESQEQ